MRKIIYILTIVAMSSACRPNGTAHSEQRDTSSASITTDELSGQTNDNPANNIEGSDDDKDIQPMSGERNLAAVDLSGDSIISINAYMRLDHQIFGYAKADTTSEKLIVLSVFTNDVKDNPHHCKLGAYYDTSKMNFKLKFIGVTGNFVEALALGEEIEPTIVYFKKEWIAY